MIQRITDRLHREDKGFTLIELMVVVLIIAILIAIAIPTFLGARRRAQDRAAQSSVRNAVTNAKAIYTDNETYADATAVPASEQEAGCATGNGVYAGRLVCAEPSLTFLASSATPSTNQTSVSVAAPTAATFYGAVRSSSNTCWYVKESVAPDADPGTHWKRGPTDAAGANCDADTAVASATAWDQRTPGTANAV